VALNIKNERVCRLARDAARLTGRSQVSVLEEALEAFLAAQEDTGIPAESEAQQRIRRSRALLATIHAELSETDRIAIRQAADQLYDETGLPA